MSSRKGILFQITLKPKLIKTGAVDNAFEIIQNNMSSLVKDIIYFSYFILCIMK